MEAFDALLGELKRGHSELKEGITEVNNTLIRHEEALKQHIYRTEIAEKRIDRLDSEIEPLKTHARQMEGAAKLIGLLAVLAALASTIFKMML